MTLTDIRLGRNEVLNQCSGLVRDGHRLMTMFAEEGEPRVVNMLFRKGADVTRLSYMLGSSAVPVSEVVPNAMPFERLMSEMSGVRFDDGPREPLVYRRTRRGSRFPGTAPSGRTCSRYPSGRCMPG